MALEKLQSVFNNISENQYDLEDGIPVESISNSLYDDFHSFGTQGNYNGLIDIPDISKKQNPSPLMAINGIFAEDGTRIPVNPDVNGHNFGKIRINDNAGTNLLQTVGVEYSGNKGFGEVVVNKNNEVKNFTSPYNLGKGKFVLESLFDKTHGSSTPGREPFGEPGRLSSDLLLHTSEGIGSTRYLNIRETQGYGGRGDEPYIVKPIGAVSPNKKASGYDRDFIPYNAAKDDFVRLGSYYISDDGLAFIGKENLTNLAIGEGILFSEPFRSLMLPPAPIPMTGLLNFYHQSKQGKFEGIEFSEKVRSILKFDGIPGFPSDTIRKPGQTPYSEAFGNPLKRAFIAAKQGDIDKKFDTKFTNPLKFQIDTEYKNRKFEYKPFDENEKNKLAQASFNRGNTNKKSLQRLQSLGAATDKASVLGNKLVRGIGQTGLTLFNKAEQAARKVAEAARAKAEEKLDEIINEGVKLTENPTAKFSGLGNTRAFDFVSQTPVPVNGEAPNEGLFETGDFYVRIRDLRAKTRVLLFRGYVTGITENLTPTWNPTTYIGRSEDVWIYQKAERDLSFNLRVAPSNKKQLEYMYQKMEALTSLVYPFYTDTNRMQPPFVGLYMAHIGSKSTDQFAYIKSMTYTVNEQGDWDAMSQSPRVFDIALSFQILNKKPPNMLTKFYQLSPENVQDPA